MRILISLVFLSVSCGIIESVVVDCTYGYHNGYTCFVQNSELITSKNDREITGVRGQHESGKSNDDVKMFFPNGKKVHYFPRGLTKFFKNLETVAIYSAGLKEITKEDLEEFGGNLKKLWLAYNSIEVIEADLFEFNANLEYLELVSNKVKHIESGAFDGLKKFKSLDLTGNIPCKFVTSIVESERQCKDPNYIPRITTTRIHNKILKLEGKFTTLQQSVDLILNKLSALETQAIQHNKKVIEENVSSKIEVKAEMKAQLLTLKEEFGRKVEEVCKIPEPETSA